MAKLYGRIDCKIPTGYSGNVMNANGNRSPIVMTDAPDDCYLLLSTNAVDNGWLEFAVVSGTDLHGHISGPNPNTHMIFTVDGTTCYWFGTGSNAQFGGDTYYTENPFDVPIFDGIRFSTIYGNRYWNNYIQYLELSVAPRLYQMIPVNWAYGGSAYTDSFAIHS